MGSELRLVRGRGKGGRSTSIDPRGRVLGWCHRGVCDTVSASAQSNRFLRNPTPGTEAVDDPSCRTEGHSNRTGPAKQDDELRNRAYRLVGNVTTPVVSRFADF